MTRSEKTTFGSEGTKPHKCTSVSGPGFHAPTRGAQQAHPPRANPCHYLSSSWPMLPLPVKAQPSALRHPLRSLGPWRRPLPAPSLCAPFAPAPPGPGAFSVLAGNRYPLPPPCPPGSSEKARRSQLNHQSPGSAAGSSDAERGSGLAGTGPISKQRARIPGAGLLTAGGGGCRAGASVVRNRPGRPRQPGPGPPGNPGLEPRSSALEPPRVRGEDGAVGRGRNGLPGLPPVLPTGLLPRAARSSHTRSEEGGERWLLFSGERRGPARVAHGGTAHPSAGSLA